MKAKNGDNKEVNRAMQYDGRGEFVDENKSKLQIAFFNKLFSKRLFSLTLITAIMFFCFAAMVSTPCIALTPTPTPAETFPKDAAIGVAVGAIVAILAAFVLLICLGYRADKKLDKGEMRRAIAGTFVVGFSIIAILSFVSGVLREHIVTAYIELVGIVIGFYFGQKAATATKPET